MARYFFRNRVLQTARLELGLTQEQAAEALRVDVRTYRRYETGEVNEGAGGFDVRRAARRRLMTRIGEQFGICADELLSQAPTECGPDVRPEPLHVHILPPPAQFVGRTAELDSLTQWARRPCAHPNVQAVVAVGGAGKSALAQQLVECLSGSPTPVTLVWSFYDDRRVGSLFSAALQWQGLVPPEAPLERVQRVLDTLARPQLWILDGLEMLQSTGANRPRGAIEDSHLRRLLAAVAGGLGHTRVLLTSRFEPVDLEPWRDKGFASLSLGPLGDGAQLELLRRWGIQGTDGQARRHLARFGGHALSLVTLCSYVVGMHAGRLDGAGVLDLEDAASDDPQAYRLARLLDTYADAMTPEQRALLATVAAFPRGARLDGLLDLTQSTVSLRQRIPAGRRGLIRALSQLETMGIVHRSREVASVYTTHPFVADHFRHRLGDSTAEIHDYCRDLLSARLAEQRGTSASGEQVDVLEELIVHTLLGEHLRDAVSLYCTALGGFDNLGLVLGDMTRGVRILQMFFEDGDPFQPLPGLEDEDMGLLLYDLALYANAVGESVYACDCLKRCAALAAGDPCRLTTALRTHAYVMRLQSRFEEALLQVEAAVAVALNEPCHLARNLALRAAILHDMGDSEAASAGFEVAGSCGDMPRPRWALWQAEHLVEEGRALEALRITRANLDACRVLAWGGHIAHCHVVLGTCFAREDPAQAQTHLAQAWAWAHRSGEVEAQLRCHELNVRLIGDDGRDGARAEALQLAQYAGFARFTGRLQP